MTHSPNTSGRTVPEPRALRRGWATSIVGACAFSVIAAAALLSASCGRPESASAASGLAVHQYTVRGIVALLPTKENPTAEFTVHHEAVPHFVGDGGALGMASMQMPFPLKDGVSLEGIGLGDKIEMTFEVDYDTAAKQPVGYRVTGVKKLPEDTRLSFTSEPSAPSEPGK